MTSRPRDPGRRLSAVFETLADPRRRLVLVQLADHRETTLPDLAELVAEAETGQAVGRGLSDERVRETYFDLYHCHVPKLEAAELVVYDQKRDLIGVAKGMGDVLQHARAVLASLSDEPTEPFSTEW